MMSLTTVKFAEAQLGDFKKDRIRITASRFSNDTYIYSIFCTSLHDQICSVAQNAGRVEWLGVGITQSSRIEVFCLGMQIFAVDSIPVAFQSPSRCGSVFCG